MKGKGQTINESIRVEAYLLSEKSGHPGGMEQSFWTQAEAIVHARATAMSVAAKPVAKRATKPGAAVKAKAAAKPEAEVKPKANATKKPALNGANGKDHQLSLNGVTPVPVAKRRPKK